MKQSQELKRVFEKYRIYPRKRLGQNFLIDRGAVRRIIETADLGPEDTVLEIGPGLGVLTQELAKKAKKVIAIEKDPKMCGILKEVLKDFNNIEIVQGDILKLQITNYKLQTNSKLQIPNYKLVANLPFYLTAPVIRKFLEAVEVKPQQMVLVVQKEVGQRICAKPPDMSILAVSVQIYAQPKIISYIPQKSFWPSPEVDAVLLKITPNGNKYTPVELLPSRERFFKIVRAGFSQPRKQLINNLSKKLKIDKEKIKKWLLKNNIQPIQRAETLTIEDWISLTKSCKIK